MITPWLIQRARSVRPGSYQPDSTLSKAVNFEYMGSSEFEFGALPTSLKNMNTDAESLTAFVMETIQDPNGRPLRAVGRTNDVSVEEYESVIARLTSGTGTSHRTKEYTGLDEAVSPGFPALPSRRMTKAEKADYIERWNENRTTFWWDLDNDIMMSFDENLMTNLPGHLAASWKAMNLPVPEGFENRIVQQTETTFQA